MDQSSVEKNTLITTKFLNSKVCFGGPRSYWNTPKITWFIKKPSSFWHFRRVAKLQSWEICEKIFIWEVVCLTRGQRVIEVNIMTSFSDCRVSSLTLREVSGCNERGKILETIQIAAEQKEFINSRVLPQCGNLVKTTKDLISKCKPTPRIICLHCLTYFGALLL